MKCPDLQQHNGAICKNALYYSFELLPNKVIWSIYSRTAGVGGNDTLVKAALHLPDTKQPGVRLHERCHYQAGRWWEDIRQILWHYGESRWIGSLCGLGGEQRHCCQPLSTIYSFIFSYEIWTEWEFCARVSTSESYRCMHELPLRCVGLSAEMQQHGCLLSNLIVISLCACLSTHAQVCTLVCILIHLDFVPS